MKKVIAVFLTALIVIQAFALNYVNIYSSAEGIETHVLANWDDPDKSPAAPEGAEIKMPYDGYKFGNALITGIKTIGLTPNEEAVNDSMVAMYIKVPTPVTAGTAHWTQMLFYSSDYNRPQGIRTGAPIYYIPAESNGTNMGEYVLEDENLYSKLTENYSIRIEYGYEGWIIIDLNDITVDWWNSYADMEAVTADKITAIDIVSGITDGTVIDEIQTFAGTPGQFKNEISDASDENIFECNVIANWDDPDKSPAAPEGAEIKMPYDGYKFGNALITGIKTIGLTPNEEAVNDSMVAMYIKVPTPVTAGTAHWTQMLFYSSDYNRPQGIRTGAPIYYIPAESNGTNMGEYVLEDENLYSKLTENYSIRIEYGYEGWIIIDLNDITVDWWNSYADMEAVTADKITAIDIVSGITDGTVIDEIQTFAGTPGQFSDYLSGEDSGGDSGDCKHANLKHTERKEPTCTETGNAEYWFCSDCNQYFADPNADEVLQSVILPATGEHIYVNGFCQWCGKEEPKPDPVVTAGLGHLLVDWDSVMPVNANADIIGSVSGYGNCIMFDNSQLNIYPDLSSGYSFKENDNALAFYMIIPKGSSQSFHFMVLEQSGEGYQLANEVDYYLIDQNGAVTEKSYTNQTINLPGGYAGWVIIPLSSLEIHPSYPTVDGVLSPKDINNIQYFAFEGSGPYYFDQYYAIKTENIADFAKICNANREDVGEPPEPEKPPTELDPSDDANRNGIFCNFDDVDMVSVQTSAEYSITSGNGFEGNYISFTSENAQTLLTPFQINFNAQGRTFDTAVVMRFASFSSLNADFFFALHDTLKPGKTELYQFKTKTVIYVIDNDGHFDTRTVNNQQLNVEAGFNGWLIIPFDSLERHTGWPKHNEVLNIENITGLQFWSGNAVGTFGLDDIRTVPDLYAFAAEYGDYVPPVPNSVIINDFEKGEITQDSKVSDWSAYCEPGAAVIEADTDINMGGTVALRINAKEQTSVRVKNYITSEEAQSALLYGYMGAYIDNISGSEMKFTVQIKTSAGIISLSPKTYTKDFYLLSDGNIGLTEAYGLTDSYFAVPEGFKGYIIWNISSYAQKVDISQITEVIIAVPAKSSLITDNISLINDVNSYISEELNSIPDSDYILPNNSSVNVDGDLITLENAAVSSTVFRKNVSVRRGYYIVFNDGDGNQVFGFLKDLLDIKKVNVFQSGKLIKSYTVTNFKEPAEEDDSVPDAPEPEVPEKTPETTVKAKPLIDELTGIEVGYYSGAAFESGTNLLVEPLPNKDLPDDAYGYLKSRRYIPYRISLLLNGGDIKPDDVLCMRFPVPDCFDIDKALIYRITDDGWLEDMQAVTEYGYLVIYAEKCGTYIILQDAETDIGNKAGIYGIDVDEGMEEETPERQKYTGVRVIKGESMWWIIAVAAAVVIAGASVTIIILFLKKRKSRKSSGTKGV